MKLDIHHIAQLANLELSEEEKKKLEKQLSDVLSHIEKLNSLDTKNVEPTAQVTNLENVTREDKIGDSLSQDDAISQAARTHNGLFEVKGIFEDE